MYCITVCRKYEVNRWCPKSGRKMTGNDRNPKLNTFAKPVLGFVAYSGTGKTTLLTQLIPILKNKGLKLALIKHSHHHFEIDHKGKDSYRLREAGADQMVIASKKRIAWIAELDDDNDEPSLVEALSALRLDDIDVVLVEGFKGESFDKIELHRRELNKPYMYVEDNNVMAVAVDEQPSDSVASTEFLDINDIDAIASYVLDYCQKFNG